MANTKKPRNGAQLLKAIKPQLAEETTRVCLRPDLLTEYNTAVTELEELVEERDQLRKAADGSRGGRMASRTSPAEQDLLDRQRAAAQRVQDVEKRMADYEVEFTFRAMGKDKWRDLVDANPPREGNQIDFFEGFNRDAVLDASVRPSLVDPDFDDCSDTDCAHDNCGSWQMLLGLLNAGQWQRLRDTAGLVNRGVADAPKSQTASDILQKVAGESRPPETSESPPDASKARSRRKSTTTTTPTESS